jgi:hypothetical protein
MVAAILNLIFTNLKIFSEFIAGRTPTAHVHCTELYISKYNWSIISLDYSTMLPHSLRKCLFIYSPCNVVFRNFASKNARASLKGPAPLLLAAMPVISFGLGTWQVYRLQWKKSLIQQLEDRTMKEPLEITDRLVHTTE